METSICHRGEFSPIPEGPPPQKIDRGILNPGGPRPSFKPIQTREGFASHQALGQITAGKGPTKLQTMSAKHLEVKSAAHLKK